MGSPRKYETANDYPVKFQLYFTLRVEVVNELEKLGYDYGKMSKEIQEYFTNIAEKSMKKDS